MAQYIVLPAPGWFSGNFATVLGLAETQEEAIALAEKEAHAVAYATSGSRSIGDKVPVGAIQVMTAIGRPEPKREPSMFDRLGSRRKR